MKIKRLHNDAILPRYSSEGASAFDVFAFKEVNWHKNSNGLWFTVIETGWAFEIPHEHGLFILSRSGHGFKNDTTLANSIGLLDYDYRGQLMVKLICFEKELPEIEVGKAVAQCVLLPTPKCYFMITDDLTETERNTSGFGSTDK